MKTIAVVVTYNRLDLLKKCIASVISQHKPPDEIIVVNNGSTDGTAAWLKEQQVTVLAQPNMGGAGGFSSGIRLAYEHDADWIWVMDDDTIPQPDALEELLRELAILGAKSHLVGFLSSTALWTDGSPNQMNLTYALTNKEQTEKLLILEKDKMPLIQFGTFVSMLISAKAVNKVGLPIKEYFIWNDDIEYSKRIIASGLAGIAVENSVVLHNTPLNQMSSVFKDSHANLWKYRYGMRNELFTKRLHDGALRFWITWVHRMFIMPFRIIINRKNYRWAFIKMIWQTSIDALFFKPNIEFVKST